MKVALHSTLRPGQETAYDEAHASIPDEMMAALRAAGITEWMIWRSGRHLFHMIECDDFDRAMAKLAGDPVNERWQERMAVYVESFVGDRGGADPGALPEVWTLTGQLAGQEEGA